MADWALPDGRTVRCEVAPVFCANCGKHGAWAPLENMTFLFYLCGKCFESHAPIAGTFALPDEQFCLDVGHEMQERFRRTLTEAEVVQAADANTLGPLLAALERESPYGSIHNRPKEL